MAKSARVLVIAHGHPAHSPGGGEIAAHALHMALQASDDFNSVFLARHTNPYPAHAGSAFSGSAEPAEILFHTSMGDHFLFRPEDPKRIWRHFREMLEFVRPDIVHFHHYLHLGLEMLGEVRRLQSRVPIILTLHDFQAICHNHGQMVHARKQSLCLRASPDDCQGCFPSRSTQDFALRERYIKSWFECVDRFVAPSAFLAERYIQWGIERSRIDIIENLMNPDAAREIAVPSIPKPKPETTSDRSTKLRIAYFGRINSVKGVNLLLQAISQLAPPVRARLQLDIHGAGMERLALGQRWSLKLHAMRLRNTVRFHGAYRPAEIPALMRDADWMVMPSRWWENSPVVILEAKRHGLPVICSDIGGMAEKIEHRVTGLHFRANDARALAERLTEVASMGDKRQNFSMRIRNASDQDAIREQHLTLHRELYQTGKPVRQINCN